MKNDIEESIIPMAVAEDIHCAGFRRNSRLLWYTDIQEADVLDEECWEFAIPAYSDDELALILPANVEINGRRFYRYFASGYDYATGQDVHRAFYGNSEGDQFPLIYAQSSRNAADAKGKVLLQLIARGMVN